MTDGIGNELQIGDWVAASDSEYANILIGKVTGFTPKMCRIEARYVDRAWKNPTIKSATQIIKLGYDPLSMTNCEKPFLWK